jgi:hypothetical protein
MGEPMEEQAPMEQPRGKDKLHRGAPTRGKWGPNDGGYDDLEADGDDDLRGDRDAPNA